jgi:hypothetical protein
MRPGITIQHSREVRRESDVVRSDITGIIGVIPKARWPEGAGSGDYVEVPLTNYGDIERSPAKALFDPVSLHAVRAFFVNGGDACRLFGVCIESEKQLMTDDPFRELFLSLLYRLRGEEDIGLLIMPILAYLPIRQLPGGEVEVPCQPTMELLLAHCREMNNRFLILDVPRGLHEDALLDWVAKFRKKNRTNAGHGALYYPWVRDGDTEAPASGYVSGVYARTELEHAPFGVKWPPANQIIRGVTHPAVALRWRDTGPLIDAHLNLIMTQPARGVVVWGARTLSYEPQWAHINARRIVSMVSEQLRRDSEWVVFENQRPELWEIVARSVRSRLDQLWSAGLLTGDQAGLEYLVQCDSELNPPETRDAGQVHVQVTLRPISTAEFIVVELRLGT